MSDSPNSPAPAEKIIVSCADGVMRLVLNRPHKKNALDREMYLALIDALDVAARDEGVRAVVFCAAGLDFTAGNDLADFRDFLQSPGEFPALRFVRALAAFEKPLVAAAKGDAIGLGTTLLFHCDLVYAAPDARFSMPFIDLALVPEAAASLLVPRRIGQAKAAQFLMLGDSFDGSEALRLGIANGLAPADAVDAVAIAAAMRLAQKPPQALRATRQLLRGDRTEILARIDEEAALFAKAIASAEAQRRFIAFFARR